MVSTDGHRLAYVDRNFGSDLQGLDGGVIIPRKGLSELNKNRAEIHQIASYCERLDYSEEVRRSSRQEGTC